MIPLLVVGFFVGAYYLHSYLTGGGQGRVDRHFKLAPGEKSSAFWSAEFATKITFGQQAGNAALGLLAGAMVGSLGIATLRPRGISLVLTNRQRLVLCIENENGKYSLFHFQPGQVGIRVLGDGGKKMQGGASVVIRFEAPSFPPVDMRAHHSAGPLLEQWAGNFSQGVRRV